MRNQTINTPNVVSVIIVNWNAGTMLRDCVESVTLFGKPFIAKIIVVDNASTDDSVSVIEDFDGVTLILSKENLGFAKACNLGASHANTDFLLFLNPDAKLTSPDTLLKVLESAQNPANEKAGIFGVKLHNSSNNMAVCCSRFPSLTNTLATITGLDRVMPALGPTMSADELAETQKVDQIIGAFFLVRRYLFEKMKGFDERFFVYYEEVDFSLRAKNAGWHSLYISDVTAFHAEGKSSDQAKAQSLFYLQRSRILYSKKHFDLLSLLIVIFATILIEPIVRSIAAILIRSKRSVKDVWGGYCMLLRWLPKWIAKGAL